MKIKIIRHLEEVTTSEMDRDGDIDPSEINLLLNHYLPFIFSDVESGDYEKIVIISSDKLRSTKTSNILVNELKRRTSIEIESVQDPRTSAEIHGVYKKGTSLKHPSVKKAKFTYLHEAFEKNNV